MLSKSVQQQIQKVHGREKKHPTLDHVVCLTSRKHVDLCRLYFVVNFLLDKSQLLNASQRAAFEQWLCKEDKIDFAKNGSEVILEVDEDTKTTIVVV